MSPVGTYIGPAQAEPLYTVGPCARRFDGEVEGFKVAVPPAGFLVSAAGRGLRAAKNYHVLNAGTLIMQGRVKHDNALNGEATPIAIPYMSLCFPTGP
jgi:hypothetical protein